MPSATLAETTPGRSRLNRPFSAIIVAIAAVLAACATLYASEDGITTHPDGLFDLMAGYVPPPGTAFSKNYFFFTDASITATTQDGRVRKQVGLTTYAIGLELGYVADLWILGSPWAFTAIVPFVGITESSRLSIPGTTFSRRHSSKVGGLGDSILVPCALHWDYGQFHLLTDLAVYAPTGNYDPDREVNTGLNRWALEPDIGLTWLNEQFGQEVSLLIGYTINAENTDTHYHSGQEFHADFAIAQHLSPGMEFGMAGYGFQQTTGDEGSGAVLGPFKGRAIALGPIFGYDFKIRAIPALVTFKYLFEFLNQNRLSGNQLWFTIAFQF